MNQGWAYENIIRPDQAGQTALSFYQQYSHSTVEDWIKRIESGQILLDGKTITPETTLKAQQKLVYHRPPWEEPTVPLEFEILYEDQDLWVIHKPSELPVLPGGKFLEHTVLGQLKIQFPTESLVPIHRLGRGTSGLLLLARSKRARQHLSQQMRDRKISKIYRALISAGDYPDKFQIDTPIGRHLTPDWAMFLLHLPRGKLPIVIAKCFNVIPIAPFWPSTLPPADRIKFEFT